MAPSTPLLTVRGSEGLYMVNGPPHFTESTVLPRESGKNCKVYTFSKDGTLFAWNNGEKLVLIYGKFYGHNEYYTAGII